MRFLFSNCIEYDNTIYAFINTTKIPIKIDPSKMQMSLIPIGKGYKDTMTDIYDICQRGQYIYILEINGKYLVKYDIENNEYMYINIGYRGNSWDNFIMISEIDEMIYILPKKLDYIIIYDISNNNVLYQKNKYKDLKNRVWAKAVQYDNRVFLFEMTCTCIWEYDFSTKKIKKVDICEKLDGVVNVICYEGYIFILLSNGDVYKWEIENRKLITLRKCNNCQLNNWYVMVPTHSKLWLMPAYGTEIVCLDIETGNERIVSVEQNEIYKDMRLWSKFYGYCEIKDSIYFAMRSSKYLYSINKMSQTLKKYEVKPISETDQYEYMKICLERVVCEGNISLSDYIKYTLL